MTGLFKALDKGNAGSITHAEFATGMRGFGLKATDVSEDEFNTIFRDVVG